MKKKNQTTVIVIIVISVLTVSGVLIWGFTSNWGQGKSSSQKAEAAAKAAAAKAAAAEAAEAAQAAQAAEAAEAARKAAEAAEAAEAARKAAEAAEAAHAAEAAEAVEVAAELAKELKEAKKKVEFLVRAIKLRHYLKQLTPPVNDPAKATSANIIDAQKLKDKLDADCACSANAQSDWAKQYANDVYEGGYCNYWSGKNKTPWCYTSNESDKESKCSKWEQGLSSDKDKWDLKRYRGCTDAQVKAATDAYNKDKTLPKKTRREMAALASQK